MKIIEFGPEKKVAKLKVDNQMDLWHLQNILEAGDFVTAKTLRTIFIQREEKKEKARKKFLLLKVKVEKIEFDEYKNKLRVIGRIVEAPKDVQEGSYHTIEVGLGNFLTIEKEEWKKEHVERMERAKIRISILKEPEIIQEFFIHVNKDDGFAVYGFDRVNGAADMGAVKIALIPEDRIHDKTMEELIKKIESKRGEIKLVSKKQIVGEKFCRMYDVAAILRFKID